MAEQNRLILISERPEDFEFSKAIANRLKMTLLEVRTADDLMAISGFFSTSMVLWDLDRPEYFEVTHSLAVQKILSILADNISSDRVFALSDQPFSFFEKLESDMIRKSFVLTNNILRKYGKGSIDIISSLIGFSLNPKDFSFSDFFPQKTKIHKVALSASEHKVLAAQAVENFLSKSGIPERVSAKVSQACDELLMNAIFDAFRDRKGAPRRRFLDRKEKFNFFKGEVVSVELGMSGDYIGICVHDRHGALKKEDLLKHLTQSYTQSGYTPRKFTPNAGLGLYGIVRSGLSLLMHSISKAETNAVLFFPQSPAVRDFKNGFQFISSFFSGSKG